MENRQKNHSGKSACVQHPETRHHGSFDKERANELPPAPAAKHKLELAGAFMAFYTSLTRLHVGLLKDKVYPANMYSLVWYIWSLNCCQGALIVRMNIALEHKSDTGRWKEAEF